MKGKVIIVLSVIVILKKYFTIYLIDGVYLFFSSKYLILFGLKFVTITDLLLNYLDWPINV